MIIRSVMRLLIPHQRVVVMMLTNHPAVVIHINQAAVIFAVVLALVTITSEMLKFQDIREVVAIQLLQVELILLRHWARIAIQIDHHHLITDHQALLEMTTFAMAQVNHLLDFMIPNRKHATIDHQHLFRQVLVHGHQVFLINNFQA